MKILSDEEILSVPGLDTPKNLDGSYNVREMRMNRERAVVIESQKDTLRQVRELLDGIENPPYHNFNAVTKFERIAGFNEAIQAVRQALKEKELK